MITVCAWRRPGDGPCTPSMILANDGKADGRVSHGICWGHAQHMREKLGLAMIIPCRDAVMEKVNAQRKEEATP